MIALKPEAGHDAFPSFYDPLPADVYRCLELSASSTAPTPYPVPRTASPAITRHMSASADSDSSSRSEKRPSSPSFEQQNKRQRPGALALDQPAAWNTRAPSDSADDTSSSIVDDSPRIQLPSIFSALDDPFRPERQSPRAGHSSNIPSALASFQFPPPQQYPDDDRSSRPKLVAETQLGLSFNDQSLNSATTLSSSNSNSLSFPSSTLTSPLSEYGLSRTQALPSLQFPDSDHWSSNPSSVSLPGITRPNSTGHISAGLKYEDAIRHASGSYSSHNSSATVLPMYGNAARISGQPERRASYAQSATSDGVKDEWSLGQPDFLLPSSTSTGTSSPSRSPNAGSRAPARRVPRGPPPEKARQAAQADD
ncbi:hypothetical protein EWM64_g10677 [Hericium alpestre]|uniref:Uncharacterized protein n=1 Tax=Hericium alpestre TaxID=135208 RepID=A0A4Y9ZEZ5_9AGAM|nr:hypothetical protein EWM64_g10677 [Hericium alpestre]